MRFERIPVFLLYFQIGCIKEEFLGFRSPSNRSLLDVNEDCEDKSNAKITF